MVHKLPKIGISGFQDPEDCDSMLRHPELKHAWDFLHELRRKTKDKKLVQNLSTLLEDHLRLEGEVSRLSGIVRNENKMRRERQDKWWLIPEKQETKTDNQKPPKPWDEYAERYFRCSECKGIKRFVEHEATFNQIVSVDGKPMCYECLRK